MTKKSETTLQTMNVDLNELNDLNENNEQSNKKNDVELASIYDTNEKIIETFTKF